MPLKTKNNTNKNTTTKSKYMGSSKKRFSSMHCNDSTTQFQGGPLGRTASLKKKWFWIVWYCLHCSILTCVNWYLCRSVSLSIIHIHNWGIKLISNIYEYELYQCVLLKNSFILKMVDVTKLWNSTWNSSGKCSAVNKRQINFHNFTDAGFSHTHPYLLIVHILSKHFQFNINSLFRFNIRE